MDSPPSNHEPLSDTHMSLLSASAMSAKPVRKAAGYARLSGWMTLGAGAISTLFSLGSIPGMTFGILLSAIGMRELSLSRKLDLFDLRAPSKLAINQILLGSLLAGYAVFKVMSYDPADSVLAGSLGSDPTIASMPELAGTLEELGNIEYLLNLGIAAVLVVVAVVIQGGTALYYWSKRKRVRQLHQHTPTWVLDVHAALQNPEHSQSIKRAA
ncbi:MAG: hypothetical protein AB8C13_07710 [Phycisphaerales bacterium]